MTKPYPALDESGWCVPLTQGLVALIDEADIPLVAPYQWRVLGGRGKYAIRQATVPELNVGAPRHILMHRTILEIVYEPAILTDHINNDGLDNRRVNLRRATLAENNRNVQKPAGRSGFRGVRQSGCGPKWQASIAVNGRYIHGGVFTSPIEAAAKYNELARQHHGAFAILNELEAEGNVNG